MSQSDMNVANGSGAVVRADMNAHYDALVTLSSGSTEPATKFAFMWWADTTTGILKQRNAANTAWISQYVLANGLTGDIKGADIASASPLVVGTDGNYLDVTGTTGFAAMTVSANRAFTLQFDGILTLTHHATNLNLPGGANITTAAGDRAICFSTGTNTVHVLTFVQAGAMNLQGRVLQRPLLLDYAETLNFIGATGGGTQDIDYELGNVAELLVTTSTNTITISKWPVTGECGNLTIKVHGGGTQTFSWPTYIDWEGGLAPTFVDNTAAFTTDFATDDKLDVATHGFKDGAIVQVTTSAADLPAGLAINTLYYIVNGTTNDFELSLTEGGAAVDITDDGTGTHTIHTGKATVVVETTNGGLTASAYAAGVDLR